jgi:hypothetical protein
MQTNKHLIQAEPVTKIVKEQSGLLKELINKTEKFWCGWAECLPEGKIIVGLRGHTPFYIKKECYLFQRVQITQHARKGHSVIKKTSKELLEELLEEIGIRRIVDEDGCNGIFYKEEKDGKFIEESSAYCYINPYIPNGHFENHILETKYVNII